MKNKIQKRINAKISDLEYMNDNYDQFEDYEIEEVKIDLYALRVLHKLQSLPTRTLETLEEGDWVEVSWVDEHFGYKHRIKGTVTDVVKFDDPQFNWFCVDGDVDAEIRFGEVTKIEIINKDVYEILKGVIGNE